MANVTLWGASYSDVPAVILPQTGGGTVTFYENGGGGGQAYDDLIAVLGGTFSGAFSNSDITRLKSRVFADNRGMTSVSLPNLTDIGDRPFEGSNLSFISCPNLETAGGYFLANLRQMSGDYIFSKLSSVGTEFIGNAPIEKIALPALTSATGSNFANGNTTLTTADFANISAISGWAFRNTSVFDTLILRKTSIPRLDNVNAFVGSLFDSGGTGGTIYIPKSLYDHLGDGTALDYKNATNWSVIDGYGTITWAQIEGSYYETHYADGTEIPQGGTA